MPFRRPLSPTMYEEDVHRDLTYVLALAAGFKAAEARAISKATQEVDEDPEKQPFASRKARRDYHFTTPQRRAEMWLLFEQSAQRRDRSETFTRLGDYFHAQQDSYSHAGYNTITGHLIDRHAPTKPITTFPKPTVWRGRRMTSCSPRSRFLSRTEWSITTTSR